MGNGTSPVVRLKPSGQRGPALGGWHGGQGHIRRGSKATLIQLDSSLQVKNLIFGLHMPRNPPSFVFPLSPELQEAQIDAITPLCHLPRQSLRALEQALLNTQALAS